MVTKYLSAFFIKIGNGAVWGGYFAAILGWAMSVILPIKDFLIITSALVVLDLITGIVAAKKRKEEIRSRFLMRTTVKLLLYYSAILATEGVQVVFAEKIPITYITAFTIALTELKSILENVDAGTGSRLAKMIIDKLKAK
jgi:phage-related holin